jgi:hypothetical protein
MKKQTSTVNELSTMLEFQLKKIKDKDETIKACRTIMKMAGVPQLIIDNPTVFDFSGNLTKQDFVWAAEEIAKYKNSNKKQSKHTSRIKQKTV